MILTGNAIRREREAGTILIDPFDPASLNPNSYNFRLGDRAVAITAGAADGDHREDMVIPPEGFVLQANVLYLAHTHETLGSQRFAMTLLGRSSLGRLGLFLNITADLGHVGSASQWTLELSVVQPLRVYPFMRVGQIAFWATEGPLVNYCGRYSDQIGPVLCQDIVLLRPHLLLQSEATSR